MSVQTSTNYSDFKTLEENRAISQSHVNRLKMAIEDSPKILAVQPILVNEHMEIIDGQHRFQACKELNLPVHYTVVNGLSVKDARKMNVIQRGWGGRDYVESYAKAGNVYYKALLQFLKEHPSLNLSIVRGICLTSEGRNSRRSYDFRNGDFTIERSIEEVDWFLDKLDTVHEVNSGEIPIGNAFVTGLVTAVDKHDDFNMEEFIDNLKKNPQLFHRTSTTRDALRMIEDIYNFRKSINKIRLY